MRLQSLDSSRHKTGIVHANGNSDGRRLDKRHFEPIAMNDIKDLAQALLQHERKVFRAHGNKDLVLTPDIHRHINRPYPIRADTRSVGSGVAKRLDIERNSFVFQRPNGLRMNDLCTRIAKFDGILVA